MVGQSCRPRVGMNGRDALRDVKDERPGTIAVDENGGIFIAEGGDDDMGAKCWVVLNQNQKTT